VKKVKKVKADDDIYTFRRSPPSFLFCFVFWTFQCTTVKGWRETHVTGQDCWALVSRRPQSIVYTHLHHRAHVYSSSHSPVCVRNNIGGSGGGGGGFFLRTILLTRSRIFWTKPKMFDIFWWGMNFLIRAVIYQLLLSGWGRKKCRTTFSGRRRADQKTILRIFQWWSARRKDTEGISSSDF
jgi:hypothetical protein